MFNDPVTEELSSDIQARPFWLDVYVMGGCPGVNISVIINQFEPDFRIHIFNLTQYFICLNKI